MAAADDSSSSKPADEPVRFALASSFNLAALRARAARLPNESLNSPPRLVLALSTRLVPALAGSARFIREMRPMLTMPRCRSLPRVFGTLVLGESLTVDLVALPLEAAFAPLWNISLPGSAALVLLQKNESAPLLAACCESAGVKFTHVEELVSALDLRSPESVATLIVATLRFAADPSARSSAP